MDGHAVVAGYSGQVVELDRGGRPLRGYDIGTAPKQVLETGDYLYILTATRLYVLSGEMLHALVDTSDGGALVMGGTGLGLLEPKRFRWFSPEGTHLGTVLSKDPIRRFFSTSDGLVVESRTWRAVVNGAPGWWD